MIDWSDTLALGPLSQSILSASAAFCAPSKVVATAITQPVVVVVLSSSTTALTKPGTFLAALSSTDFTLAP